MRIHVVIRYSTMLCCQAHLRLLEAGELYALSAQSAVDLALHGDVQLASNPFPCGKIYEPNSKPNRAGTAQQ